MAPAALPAPNTKVLPLGTEGKKAAVLSMGKARFTAASNNCLKKTRGLF
jgi:hypothetical protein